MKVLAFMLIFIVCLSYNTFADSECDYKVEILVDKEVFEKEEFSWRMIATKIDGVATNITGTAEIQSNNKTIKNYKPWNSEPISRQKTSSKYTPNLNPGEYKIIANINVECNDINKDNNIDTEKIIILGEEETKAKNGSSDIQNEIKINITKSEEIETKKNDTDAQNEVNINKIISETRNQSANKKIENIIQQTTIKKLIENEEENIIQLSKNTQNKIQSVAIVQPETVYESSNEKVKNLIIIFLLILSILLNIILIWKR